MGRGLSFRGQGRGLKRFILGERAAVNILGEMTGSIFEGEGQGCTFYFASNMIMGREGENMKICEYIIDNLPFLIFMLFNMSDL